MSLDNTLNKLGLVGFDDRSVTPPFVKMENEKTACRCASGYHSEVINNLWGGEPSCRCVPNDNPISMLPDGRCQQLIGSSLQIVPCPSTNYNYNSPLFIDEMNRTLAKLFNQGNTIAVGEPNPTMPASNFIKENKGLIILGIGGAILYSMFGKRPRPKSVSTTSDYKY